MSVLEQMTYLFFMKMLDDAQIKNAAYKQQMAQGCAIEHQKELIKQSIKEVETLLNSRMDYYFN
jgi:hypothetical protein